MPQLLKLGFFEHWTGGVQGLVVTKPDAPFGLPMSQDMWLYYFTLVIAIGIYIASVNLLRSRSGRAFMAIRDNEIAASAMGVDVALYKTLAFGVSRRHHRRRRRSRRHRGAVRGAGRLHHHARDLAVPRHGRRRRRLAAGLDRRFRLHHLRAEYRRSISRRASPAPYSACSCSSSSSSCRMAQGRSRWLPSNCIGKLLKS